MEYGFEQCETRRNKNGPYHKPDVLAALEETRGNLAASAALLGRSRNALRDYILSRPDVKARLDEIREELIDQVEDNVFRQAAAGDGPNARFVLSTLGKGRGYTTRVEHGGIGGGPIRLITSDMTPEQAAEAYADTL